MFQNHYCMRSQSKNTQGKRITEVAPEFDKNRPFSWVSCESGGSSGQSELCGGLDR